MLVKFSLKNSFAVLAGVLALAFLGWAVYPKIPTDILPSFKKPVVATYYSYPGLPTLDMEKSVSARVERVLTMAGKRDTIEARIMPGACIIKVTFQAGADPSAAMNDVVNIEMSDLHHLPPGIEVPFTMSGEPANLPVVLAAIGGEGLTETDLYKIGYYAVRNKMGGIKGVQIPHPFGGKFRQMMIYIDPDKLAAHHLEPLDVVNALEKANLVLGGGTMQLGGLEYQVHPVNTLPGTADIDNVPVAVRDGQTIFIKDIGYAQDDAAIQYNVVRVNGKRSVYCPLLREPGENTVQVVDRIRDGLAEKIPAMKKSGDIPESTEITLVSDQSTYIRQAMAGLQKQIMIGALLVVLIVILFLRRFRPSLAILLMLPLSLLAGILGFYFTGETLNVMTIGGLALAVGTVVDAGIVVVENIIRHRQLGKNPVDAARDGAEEVSMPILAGVVTTLAVFIPALFLTGMIKFMFQPLALAAVLTIAASYVIAMTVCPTFCARFPTRAGKTPNLEHNLEERIGEPKGFYQNILAKSMKVRWLTILVIGGLSAACFLLTPMLGRELFPDVDAGSFEIRMKTAPGTQLGNTEKVVEQVEQLIQSIIPEDEIKSVIANIGMPIGKGAGFSTVLSSNSGADTAFLIVNLTDQGRKTSTMEYVKQLRVALAEQLPKEKFLFVTGGMINAALNEGVATPIDIQVSSGSLEACRVAAEKVERAVKTVPGAVDVQIAQSLDYPQLDIKVDRAKAALVGLTQEDVAKNVLTAYGSSVGMAPMIWVDPSTGVDFYIGVQFADNRVESLDELRNIPLRIETPNGPSTVPLSSVAEISRVNIPGEIAHYNMSRINDIYVNVEDRDLGSVVKDIEEVLAGITLDEGVSVDLRGPVQTMRTGAASLGFGLLAAIVLVFLVLMAQFRSFSEPLIIMLAVPLALSGVVIALFVTNTNINIQSLMGALMLVGVVVNNSILLVEFANKQMERGHNAFEAAYEAACVRLRPILMTSLTMVASMLPFAFNFSVGNEAMVPLARAMIGGMIASTILTLFLVPCVYTLAKRHQPKHI
ncbi:efflux RND transporter permease subunit [Pontiella agarivorans]|uniref:Efflux RND transporter permease subunit n=1 Tax=Pontiella agarivorans TaxID=3038953 RepID=A0ABU5N177_9BACT|nr:efflux RND transporter permease subunit [Pontiella agarivorans]MDZ8120154.1 efflux RND transporter permease subunit [Pontiella agarivorans]